jgi:phosphate transport system substrate-binding protein
MFDEKLSLVAILIASLSSGCSRGAEARASTQTTVVVTGSSTIAPLVAELGKKFEALHPGVRVDVQSGGSSRGVADARTGVANIGMVSRKLAPEEADLTAYPVAQDGVCLILHRDNPVPTLEDSDVIAIYTGKVRNWKLVGGADRPITVVNKAEGRSTLELFLHYYKLKADQIKADVVIGDNEQGVKTVAGNPDAIGYVSIGTAEYDQRHGVAIKLVPLHGVAPSLEAVANGSFPLSRPLNLVVKGQASGAVADFLTYATSEQSHDTILGQSFVPIRK